MNCGKMLIICIIKMLCRITSGSHYRMQRHNSTCHIQIVCTNIVWIVKFCLCVLKTPSLDLLKWSTRKESSWSTVFTFSAVFACFGWAVELLPSPGAYVTNFQEKFKEKLIANILFVLCHVKKNQTTQAIGINPRMIFIVFSFRINFT